MFLSKTDQEVRTMGDLLDAANLVEDLAGNVRHYIEKKIEPLMDALEEAKTDALTEWPEDAEGVFVPREAWDALILAYVAAS